MNKFIKRYVRLSHPQDIEGYFYRQQDNCILYPKITIGQKNASIITIFTECLERPFSYDLWKSLQPQIVYQYLQKIVLGFINLKNRYGFFKITPNLICLQQQNIVKIWINQDPVLNYPSKPLPKDSSSQFIMVTGITTLFKLIISQLSSINKPNTLQKLLQFARTHTRQYKKNNTILPVHKTKPKPKLSQYTNKSFQHRYINQGYQYTNSNLKDTAKFQYNPKINIIQYPQNQTIQFLKPPTLINHNQRKRSNITYCFPFGNKEDIINQQNQKNKRKKHQNNISSFSDSKRENAKEKFLESQVKKQKIGWFSTQSTFGTLKHTKTFDVSHYIKNIAEEQNQEDMRKSMFAKKSCLNKSALDLEKDFQNLFVGDRSRFHQPQQIVNERQMQFENLLFF